MNIAHDAVGLTNELFASIAYDRDRRSDHDSDGLR